MFHTLRLLLVSRIFGPGTVQSLASRSIGLSVCTDCLPNPRFCLRRPFRYYISRPWVPSTPGLFYRSPTTLFYYPSQTTPERGQRPVYRPDAPRSVQPFKHNVHAAMFAEYATFRVSLLTQTAKTPIVIICGHSIGGGLASLAYYDLTLLGFQCVLYTFGACRVVSPAHRKDRTTG
jgi:hypothetical protein